MNYEGFSKIMASDFSVSEHIYRNEGDFLRFCPPKFLATGMSTKLLQKLSGNFIFLTQTTSWPLGITAQDISECAFAQNFSPFSSPSTKQFYLMHTTLPSVSFQLLTFTMLPTKIMWAQRGFWGSYLCFLQ